MSDPIINTLKAMKLPLTRANYTALENLGGKGNKLSPEVDAQLPDEPRFQAYRPTTHEEIAAEEAEKENPGA